MRRNTLRYALYAGYCTLCGLTLWNEPIDLSHHTIYGL